jgi:ankyrin repeat protein
MHACRAAIDAVWDNVKFMLDECIDADPNVNTVDTHGLSALLVASQAGVKAFQYLTSKGADPSSIGSNGQTSLIHATLSGRVDLGPILDVDQSLDKRDKAGRAALHYAVLNEDEQAIDALVAAGANVNIADFRGRTPLMYAATITAHHALSPLMKGGPDMEIRDQHGNGVWHYVALGRGWPSQPREYKNFQWWPRSWDFKDDTLQEPPFPGEGGG